MTSDELLKSSTGKIMLLHKHWHGTNQHRWSQRVSRDVAHFGNRFLINTVPCMYSRDQTTLPYIKHLMKKDGLPACKYIRNKGFVRAETGWGSPSAEEPERLGGFHRLVHTSANWNKILSTPLLRREATSCGNRDDFQRTLTWHNVSWISADVKILITSTWRTRWNLSDQKKPKDSDISLSNRLGKNFGTFTLGFVQCLNAFLLLYF